MEAFLRGIFHGIIAASVIIVILFTLDCIYMWLKRKDFRSKSGIRVVKRGEIPKHQVECPHCHSIIEYTRHNVWYGGSRWEGKILRLLHYIDCPVCHENIVVREEEKDKGGND